MYKKFTQQCTLGPWWAPGCGRARGYTGKVYDLHLPLCHMEPEYNPNVFTTWPPRETTGAPAPPTAAYAGPSSRFVLNSLFDGRRGVVLTPVQQQLREWDNPGHRAATIDLILAALDHCMQDSLDNRLSRGVYECLLWTFETPGAEHNDPRFLDMFTRFVAKPTQDRARATTQVFDSPEARHAWVQAQESAALQRLRDLQLVCARDWAMLCMRVLSEERMGVAVDV